MTEPSRPRLDASMTLITEMMERPLDPGYEAAARSREAAGLPPSTGYGTGTIVVATLLIGALLAIAALALRTPSTTASRAKAQLIAEINSRRAEGDTKSARIASLRSEIDAAQAELLRLQSQSALQEQLATLELVTGAAAAAGPGLTLTLDDAKRAQTGQGSDVTPRDTTEADQGKVMARDLQIVVNGLWQAGAEAIAINGQRLTARAAIRFAGQAILVDYRPLTRPYVITAIGDGDNLAANFAGTDGGSYLKSLETNYGIRSDLRTAKRVLVPGEPALTVRLAEPVPTATPTPTTPSATGSSTGSATTRSTPRNTPSSTGTETSR